MKNIILIFASTCFVFLVSGCENLRLPDAPLAVGTPTSVGMSGSAVGTWSGTVCYTAVNGHAFELGMLASINPAQDRVTTAVGSSGAETVAARRTGNVVSWSMLGSDTVTEVTLQPAANGVAQVTSRVIRDGVVMATGVGTFHNNG